MEIIKQNKSKSHEEFEKLLSEDLGNRKFKGFFTTNPDVMQYAVDMIAETLVTTFDFNKSEYAEGGKGGY